MPSTENLLRRLTPTVVQFSNFSASKKFQQKKQQNQWKKLYMNKRLHQIESKINQECLKMVSSQFRGILACRLGKKNYGGKFDIKKWTKWTS